MSSLEDTGVPPLWGEYLDYIDKTHKNNLKIYKKVGKTIENKRSSRPWYIKLLAGMTATSYGGYTYEELEYEASQPIKPEPTVVGYCNWVTRVKQKEL